MKIYTFKSKPFSPYQKFTFLHLLIPSSTYWALPPNPKYAAAAESIASFRDTSASESLVIALEDTAALVRQSAIASINRIWTKGSVDGTLVYGRRG